MLLLAQAIAVPLLVSLIMALSICSMPSMALRSRNNLLRLCPSLISRALSTPPTSSPERPQLNQITLEEEEANLFRMVRAFCADKKLKVVVRVAGGWVRDKLLQRGNKYDIDLCVDKMTGKEFSRDWIAWIKQHYPNYTTGLTVLQANADKSKHLETVCAKIGNLSVDIVNLRTEVYTSSSRIPRIAFGTPKQDAERRDLTINSLYYNLMTESVEDFTGKGLSDLREGILRTPLDAVTTLKDDPLRALRIIRFAAVLGYDVAPETLEACGSKTIHDLLMRKVSGERIIRELRLCFSASAVAKATSLLYGTGIFQQVFNAPDKLVAEPTSLPTANEWMKRHFHSSRVAVTLFASLPLPSEFPWMQKALDEIANFDFGGMHRAYSLALLTHIPSEYVCRVKALNPNRKPVRLLDTWLRDTLKSTSKEISTTDFIHSAAEDIKNLIFRPLPESAPSPNANFMQCERKLSVLLAATQGGDSYYDLSALSVGMVAIRAYPYFYPALFLACAEHAAERAVERVLQKRLAPERDVWKAVAEAMIRTHDVHNLSLKTADHRLTPISRICLEEWNVAAKFGERLLVASTKFDISLSAKKSKPAKPLLDGDALANGLGDKLADYPKKIFGDLLTIQSMWQLVNKDGTAEDLLEFLRSIEFDVPRIEKKSS